MSGHTSSLSLATSKNPLDLLEHVLSSLDWMFERHSTNEIAAEAPGKWCNYGLFFSWSAEIGALHFSCSVDIKIPLSKLAAIYELMGRMNEQLWIGHFSLESTEKVLLFRHAILLKGRQILSTESLEDMVDMALTSCEQFYPAIQFVVWGGKSPKEALDASLLECVGEA